MRWAVTFALVATSAWALGGSPSFIAAPLEVKRSPSDEVTVALNKQLRLILMKEPGVNTPTPSMWDAAIGDHRRQDCGQNDDCLRQLAILAGTLYAIYAAVELDLTRTNVVVIGRIVRRDGLLVQTLGERGFELVVPLQQRPFNVVALAGLNQLIKQMKLATLPATLPAVSEVKPVAEPGPPAQPAPIMTGPPLPPHPGPTVGKVLLGTGAGVAVAGGVIALVGQLEAASLTPIDGNLPPDQVAAWRNATTLRPAGLAIAGAGAAIAAAGALTWLLAPSARLQAAIIPQPGGLGIAFAGDLP